MTQHNILIRSLEKVAGDAEGENGGWKIKLTIFMGGTSESVHVWTLSGQSQGTSGHWVKKECD